MPNPDAPFCECQWLERAAKDDTIPIVFDEMMNEYHLVHAAEFGHSVVYHCPFCSGRAPESLRGSFFTEVSLDESYRLHQLTKEIKTTQELFDRLGIPDHDFEVGGLCITSESEDASPTTTIEPRRVVYEGLSQTADVHVQIDRYDRLQFSFTGRYIGPTRDTT